MTMKNADPKTIASFGDEWTRFDQQAMPEEEAHAVFNDYFRVFPWERLTAQAEGFDMGCGSGRWAKWVVPKVGRLHCIDPSDAIEVARKNLAGSPNAVFHRASVDDAPLAECSQDFGYSLGVLHHIPDTEAAIRCCARLLKPGAPLLLYLYYAFDNRPLWFRLVWRASDLLRRLISRMPATLKHLSTDAIAACVYWPLSRLARLMEGLGLNARNIPLYYYRRHSFYTLRTDARDRFGTPLEQRFTREQIAGMLGRAGLEEVRFSEGAPFWCVVGFRNAMG